MVRGHEALPEQSGRLREEPVDDKESKVQDHRNGKHPDAVRIPDDETGASRKNCTCCGVAWTSDLFWNHGTDGKGGIGRKDGTDGKGNSDREGRVAYEWWTCEGWTCVGRLC